MKRFIIWITVIIVLTGIGTISNGAIARAALNLENVEIPSVQTPSTDSVAQQESPLRSYLFIHDTSKNMRVKNRIPK